MGHSLYLGKLGLLIWLGLLLIGYGLGEAKPALNELIRSGNSLAQEGEYEAAIRTYKQAWEFYNSADAAYNLAVIYHHELGFWAKAIYYYEKFLSSEPAAVETTQVREWLELVRQQINPLAGQSLKQEPPSVLANLMESAGDELCQQGNEYLAQGKYEAAIGAYRQAMIVNQSAAAGYNLALLYDYELNYKAKAIYYYQRFLGLAPGSTSTPKVTARLAQLKRELLQQQGILSRAKVYKLRAP